VPNGTIPSERIKHLRGELGLTQTQLATRLGVSFVTVNRWERGHVKPSDLALQRLRELELESDFPPANRGPDSAQSSITVPDFLGEPGRVRLVIEAERLSFGHLANPAFGIETSLIDPLPHQRIAVYEHMLPIPRLRFLLADDAGAGKTVMAGLYIREMLARRLLRRVLVVPPAGLVGNWERELRRFFNLEFRVVRGQDAKGENPFVGPFSDQIICSLDTLAGQSMFGRLRDPGVEPYDLVIFDEAHKLSSSRDPDLTVHKTDRYRLAEALAGATTDDERWTMPWSARHLLLLTATPHMGKDFPYYALWRLLEPETLSTSDAFAQFPVEDRAKRFIRRTKEEMVRLDGRPLYTERRSDTLGFDLTSGEIGEQVLYDRMTAYMRSFYNRAGILNQSAARLALSVFQRRLASSTYALMRSLERRLERLEEILAQVRQGRLSIEQLRTAQRKLSGFEDPFDATSPDDEANVDGRESHESDEEALLRNVLVTSMADLEAERTEVQALVQLSRAVLAGGHESKFETLRDLILSPDFRAEKLIVFTEHRDTLSWLIQRFEAMGFTDAVASIHGGMDYRQRDSEIERFRTPTTDGGAQLLVATDAAGEGINLQFCWRMVNYDVPWNPARLEQRLGRIHRYGQEHDVVIVNLVANQTREGLVLGTLLRKLEAIRREMRSDKVFDVVGRLFENVSIADYMVQVAVSGDVEPEVARLEGMLTREQVDALQERERRLFGEGGDVRPHLARLRQQAQRETLRHLLPGYVRQFVSRALPVLDIGLDGDLEGVFALRPLRRAATDQILEAMEMYPPSVRGRLSVSKPDAMSPAIFIHPGEPVFERLRQMVLGQCAAEANRGATFVDPGATAPYLLYVAEWHIVEHSGDSTTTRRDSRPLHTEVTALRVFADGTVEPCPLEHVLLLQNTARFPLAATKLAPIALSLQATGDDYLQTRVVAAGVDSRRAELLRTQSQRQELLAAAYDLQAAELAGQRAKLTGKAQQGTHAIRATLDRVKEQQRTLEARKSAALTHLQSEPDRISAGPTQILARALVVPSNTPEDRKQQDADVEAAAMAVARAWEEAAGAVVKDVSTPVRARALSLGDYPGFDMLAVYPDGSQRAIEVKGRARTGDVEVSANEWARACNLRSGYWLYTVFDCGTASPRLVRVQDPFGKLLVGSRGVTIDDAAIVAAAELTDPSMAPAAPLPELLRPLFWEHDFERLRWPADRDLITGRVLQHGGDEAVRWIRQAAGDSLLADWIRARQGHGIDARQLRFWQVVLGLSAAEVDPWVEAARNSAWGARSTN
jgi:superfamily II DNA or RNA helicase/DNA-binding XRE family transcriptional regulator